MSVMTSRGQQERGGLAEGGIPGSTDGAQPRSEQRQPHGGKVAKIGGDPGEHLRMDRPDHGLPCRGQPLKLADHLTGRGGKRGKDFRVAFERVTEPSEGNP